MAHGCDVTLADVSQKAVEYALARFGDRPGFRALVLDARDAELIGQGAFDCVMVMGPFYHLLNEQERERALESVARALKPRGRLLAAAINFYGAITEVLARGSSALFLSEDVPLDPHVDNYPYEVPDGQGFTDLFMTRPAAFRAFFERHGWRMLSLAASRGPFMNLGGVLDAASPEVQRKAELPTLATCEDRDIIGRSNHLIYVGERPD